MGVGCGQLGDGQEDLGLVDGQVGDGQADFWLVHK